MSLNLKYNRSSAAEVYTHEDLNRVGEAVNTIAAELNNSGYRNSVALPTDWAATDIPQRAEMDAYIGAVQTLRRMITLPADADKVPTSMVGLTVGGANAIEKMLHDLYELLIKMRQRFMPLDTFYMGGFV